MRNALLCTTAVVLCLSFAPASAQQAITTPILVSAPNFRDLAGISVSNGGTGFVDTTSNNGVMRTGTFYRSDLLFYLNSTDVATISTLNIGRDIDLRTPTEYFANPDVLFGANLTHINIYGTLDAVPLPPVTSAPAVVLQFMQQSYQAFVTDPLQRTGFGTVLTTLAHDSDADLFHCSGGKDRTGWTAAILQSIAGVSPTTIMNDYLATNRYTAAFINAGVAQAVAQYGPGVAQTAALSLGVDASYLQAGLDQMIASYGSLNAYLIQGLGLTQADIYVLRAKMVYFSTLPGQHDFNGDGKSDIAWRHSDGTAAIWLMNGGTISGGGNLGVVPTSWSIVGQRDFDGDGKSDILWRDTSGNTAIWFMNGTSILGGGSVGSVPTSWSIVGTGDFNGDGKGDILWRDTSGNVAMWFMNGTSSIGGGSLGTVPTSWSIVGTGDFNGDGKSDILWRDTSGNVAMWFMNGTTSIGGGSVGAVPTSWSIVGTGDFDGDGKSDILWRDTSGNTAIWLMNGATIIGGGIVGVVPVSWSIVETGDFNGDGKSDILWRDTSGNTAIWFMNGATASGGASLGVVSNNWTIQGLNAD